MTCGTPLSAPMCVCERERGNPLGFMGRPSRGVFVLALRLRVGPSGLGEESWGPRDEKNAFPFSKTNIFGNSL
jgi:hypothetical protein